MQVPISGPPRDPSLHPQARALLELMDGLDAPGLSTATVAHARRLEAGWRRLAARAEPVGRVRDATAPGPGGPVPLRLYEPATGSSGALALFIHGGGWALGGIDQYDERCRALANASGRTVVSVGYRLAPEHPFPAALDDVRAAAEWIGSQAAGHRPVAVVGDSAGGNLAVCLCLLLRDTRGLRFDRQALIYPVCDSDFGRPSYHHFGDGYGLTLGDMRFFWEAYLGPGGDATNPLAAPLRAPDLSGLPPALVVTASHDVLRDEAEELARGLRQAGVPTQLFRHEGHVHDFWFWPAIVDAAGVATEQVADWLRAGA